MNKLSRRSFIKAGAGVAGMTMLGMPHIAHAQGRTLRLSHHLAPDHLVDVASKRFAALVAEKTGGALKVDVFPAGQLAGHLEDLPPALGHRHVVRRLAELCAVARGRTQQP